MASAWRATSEQPDPVITVDVHLDPADWSRHLADETALGLADRPPWIPPVWFYDETGSELFDRITRLEEYYPTRAERAILAERATTIAARTGAATLIELGSGTSDKTILLLDALWDRGTLERIVPFDVSEAVLRSAATTLAEAYEGVDVHAVVGDFHEHLGHIPSHGRRLLAFLGSTIGNLDPTQRREFLGGVRRTLDAGDWFLLGTDLVKDRTRLVRAYDDDSGVTAAFNLNALHVMNRELGADFDVDAWRHRAVFDEEHQRIEMHVVAVTDQSVSFATLDRSLSVEAGHHLRTEISTKFTESQVRAELAEAGFVVDAAWTDADGDFLLTLARPA